MHKRWLVVGLAVLLALIVSTTIWGPAALERAAYAVAAGQNQAERGNLAELSKHDQMSGLFRSVAKAVKPAVVVVQVKQRVAVQPIPWPDMDDFFKRFFDDSFPGQWQFRREFRWPNPRQEKEQRFYQHGLGSGVIVDAEKGYVLTNWHVVRDADNVQVVLADGRKLDAEWVRTDKQTDLAVIKVKPDRLISAPLGDSDQMDVGDWVLAVGAPEGLPQTVTAGIISAKGRTTGRDGYENFLQTDAAINHGNSGGPLVNMRGEVIGVNTAIVSRTGVNEGIGLAIPSNMAKGVMAQLVDGGKVVRGYMGVNIQNVDENLARSFSLPDSQGALVAGVRDDSPAQKAGLRSGDFIVAVDGKGVKDVNDLRHRVAEIRPDTTVKIEYYRDGKKQSASVKITQQPSDVASESSDSGTPEPSDAAGRFGLKVADVNTELADRFGLKKSVKGAVILEVDENSDASDQGLRPGDVITEIQSTRITTAEDLVKALSATDAKDGVRLRVEDKAGNARFVFISPRK